MKTETEERNFLIDRAMTGYEMVYGKKDIDRKRMEVRSIEPTYGSELGYEVRTMRGDDFFVIFLYLSFSLTESIDLVRMEVRNGVYFQESLGDEVYVVIGKLGKRYKEERVYSFKPLMFNYGNLPILRMIDGSPVFLSNKQSALRLTSN